MAKNQAGVGGVKNPNTVFTEVVKNPTRYKGGMNTCPEVVKNPTRYTGGLNQAACDVPKKGK
jgi:hypothetical protein